ncbi:uncharacterized protein LOC111009866 [Momordica charantia]|uniref:Uncharacterized protein LOC111009866 n=1 Tax=Momordica charantia TaxID=3673 RepID=A0A6J1CC49_MOMCH|nr:uncharacterized protein LOC111009866 [Momordica charantia]
MKALHLQLQLLPHPFSALPFHHPWRLSSRSRFSSATRYRLWDSNAEDEEPFDPGIRFRTTRNKRRRWWSDDPAPEFEEESSGILDEVIDSVWIFKVFKSYGWTLPPIIISLLLNSGPKAFLMALALPLAQSIISLALEKLWGAAERRPKRSARSRTRKRSFYSTETKVQEEEEKGKMGYGYQSWEARKEGRNGSSYGGWEDLDGVGSEREPKSGVRPKNQSSTTSMEKGKLSWREKKSDTPLLLRLLIAVFPFLGSWTRML